MKILFTIFILLLSFSTIQAQVIISEPVDFTVTLTNGEEFNLFDKLDEGKYVCIDFFFTTCGPCISNQPYFTETFQNYGCNDGDIFFLSIDWDGNDEEVMLYEENIAGENSPPAASGLEGGGSAVVNAYGYDAANNAVIMGFPTFTLIGPDRTFLEKDIWPLTDASTFTDTFTSHGIEQQVCSVVGIHDSKFNLSISLGPNPTKDVLTILLEEKSFDLEIYNSNGEIMLSRTELYDQSEVDISELVAGIYFVRVFVEGEYITERFTVVD